jgi:hypothetical protein
MNLKKEVAAPSALLVAASSLAPVIPAKFPVLFPAVVLLMLAVGKLLAKARLTSTSTLALAIRVLCLLIRWVDLLLLRALAPVLLVAFLFRFRLMHRLRALACPCPCPCLSLCRVRLAPLALLECPRCLASLVAVHTGHIRTWMLARDLAKVVLRRLRLLPKNLESRKWANKFAA